MPPVIIKMHRSRRHGSVGCTIGIAPHVYVGAYSDDAADALHKAADLASRLDQLMKDHPGVASALNVIPGGGAALKAISIASKAMQYGHTVEHVVSTYGPKVANTVKKILSWF